MTLSPSGRVRCPARAASESYPSPAVAMSKPHAALPHTGFVGRPCGRDTELRPLTADGAALTHMHTRKAAPRCRPHGGMLAAWGGEAREIEIDACPDETASSAPCMSGRRAQSPHPHPHPHPPTPTPTPTSRQRRHSANAQTATPSSIPATSASITTSTAPPGLLGLLLPLLDAHLTPQPGPEPPPALHAIATNRCQGRTWPGDGERHESSLSD